MVLPESSPVKKWTAKESAGFFNKRFFMILIIPSIIFPLFAGFNPATFQESNIMPIALPIAKLIMLIFKGTFIVKSGIIFSIVFYVFGILFSYLFLAIIFIPILFLISHTNRKTGVFAIYGEGIATGDIINGTENFYKFCNWNDVYTYLPFEKNELKIVDKFNKALVYLRYEPEIESELIYLINYYIAFYNKK